MADSEVYLAVLKAAYDYEPQPDAEGELAIKEGQLLLLLERTDDDWWKVKVKPESQDEDGPSGLVPKAYVDEAEHTSVVKALYDYEATQSTELSVSENDILYVYDRDEDWLLARKQSDDTVVGYVPGNYVEEYTGEDESAPAPFAISQIVVPPSPPRPTSVYVDPADRVAAAPKAQADDIKTWAISEVDKKGKKKKGTLGIGNGAIFFASESDKTPVQKWQIADIQDVRMEKSKHVHIDIGGSQPTNLHFHAGSKDVAEEIMAKLEFSRALSAPRPAVLSPEEPQEEIPRRSSPQKSVHFDASEPKIIPPREPSEPDEEEQEQLPDGEPAVALYDFAADGEDELTIQEGESLIVLEKDSDEWWKVRNANGAEGVVPASYVELTNPGIEAPYGPDDEAAAAAAMAAAREEEARKEAEREARAAAREQEEKERLEKERKKAEAEQRAKAAEAAAEADRKRREREREKAKQEESTRAAAAKEKEKETRRKERERESAESSRGSKSNGDSSAGRVSSERSIPSPGSTRIWHDRTGQFRVEAAFLGFNNGKLRLHKVNGVVIEVPSEKMSPEDLKYIERTQKKSSPPRTSEDDDEPLAVRRRSLISDGAKPKTTQKKSTVDWFEFFLSAGCDVDDCTRYASAFERDKIDEAILPDITESTMRSLGLREGDIIRVKKAIEQRQPKKPSSDPLQEQMRRDEELARQLQAEESGSKTRGQPPNLFTGSKGELKNSMRRGRPQPSKSTLPSSVDLQSITTASSQIQRTGSPLVTSPEAISSPSVTPVQPPSRSGSVAPVVNGFDDDAWTNRPSSTKPTASTPTPAVAAPRAPSVPPAPPASTPAAAAPLPQPTPPAAPQTTGPTLAKTDDDIFNQLARLSEYRTKSPAVQVPQRAPSVPISTPLSYQSGLGMGSSPVPIGQHLQAQQTGIMQPPQLPNGPRGPLAPVPANQTLLQPLIPTTTGLNGFVPTRPQSVSSPFQPQPQPQQPMFLTTQPTGFPGAANPSLLPQATGFPNSSPINPIMSQPTGFMGGGMGGSGLMSQPTGLPNGNFGGATSGGFGLTPSFQPNGNFGGVQTNPTGFNPGFNNGTSPFPNGMISPLPQPAPPAPNTSPANVFAQMKSGTFANDSAPQSPGKYDALRPNPSPLTAQSTGWGYQGMNGGAFTGGYGYQR